MNFSNEKEMASSFNYYLKRIIKNENVSFLSEYKSGFGIPDILVIEKSNNTINFILSLELKIRNWKKALSQAYRYKSFSNLSFVIIDEAYSVSPLKNIDLFKKFNIGIASFNKDYVLKIYYSPTVDLPFTESYLTKLTKNISECEADYSLRNPNIITQSIEKFCLSKSVYVQRESTEIKKAARKLP